MKNKDFDALQTALACCSDLDTQIADLSKLQEETTARLRKLEVEADLNDAKALSEIARLQTVVALLPNRITARQAQLQTADTELVEVTNQFISTTHNPRVRECESREREKAQKTLAPLFPDNSALASAVEGSAFVIEAQRLHLTITTAPIYGSRRHAGLAVEAWNKLAGLESKRA